MTKQKEYMKVYNKEYKKGRPWLQVYRGIHGRCRIPSDDHFISYGARGIKLLMKPSDIKTLWFRDKAFEMKRPSIDRIDNNGDYELGNCRFIEFEDNVARRFK